MEQDQPKKGQHFDVGIVSRSPILLPQCAIAPHSDLKCHQPASLEYHIFHPPDQGVAAFVLFVAIMPTECGANIWLTQDLWSDCVVIARTAAVGFGEAVRFAILSVCRYKWLAANALCCFRIVQYPAILRGVRMGNFRIMPSNPTGRNGGANVCFA